MHNYIPMFLTVQAVTLIMCNYKSLNKKAGWQQLQTWMNISAVTAWH